jgi:hypothetical protein
MTPAEVVTASRLEPQRFQLYVNTLIDAFRRATLAQRMAMVEEALHENGPIEGLVSAVGQLPLP